VLVPEFSTYVGGLPAERLPCSHSASGSGADAGVLRDMWNQCHIPSTAVYSVVATRTGGDDDAGLTRLLVVQ
jgi:hypothetical protein